ncbi:MAG: FG-GAP repeat protein [Planctomycetota bacterium]
MFATARLTICLVFTCAVASAQAPFLAAQDAKLSAPGGASQDHFGNSLALSGDTLVVGAPDSDTNSGLGFDAGAVHFFVRNGASWTLQSSMHSPAGVLFDSGFGTNVAIDGDTAVATNPGEVIASPLSVGSTTVLVRSAGVWSVQQKLVSSSPSINAHFGFSASIDGDTVLVGDEGDDTFGANTGAVYVFERSGTVWTEQAKLFAPTVSANGVFGGSLAIAGDTAVIGAPEFFVGGGTHGAAFVFTRSGTTWSHRATLLAPAPTTSENFGAAVALFGDTIVVGSTRLGFPNPMPGVAYVFVGSGSTWTLEATVAAPSGVTSGAQFARSLDLEGDRLLVGAPADSDHGVFTGAAYVFERAQATWMEVAKLTASDAQKGDDFGISVALAGDDLAIGAPELSVFTFEPPPGPGAAYVFCKSDFDTFCSGDGSLATPCPCAPPNSVPSPSGAPDAGCANSYDSTGGRLRACGDFAPETLRFLADVGNGYGGFALLVKGSANDASGLAIGDGVRCVSGALVRFGGHFAGTNGAPFGAWTYPNAVQTLAVSAATLQPSGQTAYYQLVYRNAEADFCSAGTINLTNGVQVQWPAVP